MSVTPRAILKQSLGRFNWSGDVTVLRLRLQYQPDRVIPTYIIRYDSFDLVCAFFLSDYLNLMVWDDLFGTSLKLPTLIGIAFVTWDDASLVLAFFKIMITFSFIYLLFVIRMNTSVTFRHPKQVYQPNIYTICLPQFQKVTISASARLQEKRSTFCFRTQSVEAFSFYFRTEYIIH